MILIPNQQIACKPLKTLALEKTGVNFVTAKQKNELLELTVVYPAAIEKSFQTNYSAGDRVYIRGDATTLHWAREKFDIGGQEVILVPLEQLKAWKFLAVGEDPETVFGPEAKS